jgi:hypothetical protein
MSVFSGEDWVQELIHGHSNRIKTELRMYLHVFKSLCPTNLWAEAIKTLIMRRTVCNLFV